MLATARLPNVHGRDTEHRYQQAEYPDSVRTLEAADADRSRRHHTDRPDGCGLLPWRGISQMPPIR